MPISKNSMIVGAAALVAGVVGTVVAQKVVNGVKLKKMGLTREEFAKAVESAAAKKKARMEAGAEAAS